MKGIYKYIILKNLNLIIQFYQGKITYEGLLKLNQEILKDNNYNPNFGILVDFRLSKSNISIEEIKSYSKWVNEQSILNRLNNRVILTNTPEQVTKSTIFSLEEEVKEFNYLIFSTLENSLTSLNIDISNLERVEIEIEQMRVNHKLTTLF